MQRYALHVWSNPTAGHDAEYNRWYNEQHIPDVLRVPGFVAAQRFRMNEGTSNTTPQYLAIYDVETDAIDSAMKELMSRAGSASMPMSEAIDAQNITTTLVAHITEKFSA